MEDLQRVMEAEALFMDALGGEFQPKLDPSNTHSLARLARCMLLELAEMPMQYDGNSPETIEAEVAWAPGKAFLNCAPFEMREFGRYGQKGRVLYVPVGLGILIDRSDFGVRYLKIEFFHPDIFSYNIQPNGPERAFEDGGYIEMSATSYGERSDGIQNQGIDSIDKKIGLAKVEHGLRARQAVTELAKLSFL